MLINDVDDLNRFEKAETAELLAAGGIGTGDLYAEVQRLKGQFHISDFLLSAINELGPDAAISTAFEALTLSAETDKKTMSNLETNLGNLLLERRDNLCCSRRGYY